jgi:hypothetical protein
MSKSSTRVNPVWLLEPRNDWILIRFVSTLPPVLLRKTLMSNMDDLGKARRSFTTFVRDLTVRLGTHAYWRPAWK